jgi:hypothetical protein
MTKPDGREVTSSLWNEIYRPTYRSSGDSAQAEIRDGENMSTEDNKRRSQAETQRGEDSLLATIQGLSSKVAIGSTSHWHFSITAPRWALRAPRSETLASSIAGFVALVLAGGGVALAWNADNELTTSKSGLAAQIGPWVVIAVLLIGAGAAASAAFGSRRLHLRITQLAGGEAAAKALAASVSDRGQQESGAAGVNEAVGSTGVTAMHASEAARLAREATDAANRATPDAAAAAVSAAASAHAAAATAATAAPTGAGGGPADGGPTTQSAATTTSPKVWAGTIAGAVAFSFWTIAAATFWKNTFSSEALAALVGSTTAIVAAVAAYLKTDPLRSKG